MEVGVVLAVVPVLWDRVEVVRTLEFNLLHFMLESLWQVVAEDLRIMVTALMEDTGAELVVVV